MRIPLVPILALTAACADVDTDTDVDPPTCTEALVVAFDRVEVADAALGEASPLVGTLTNPCPDAISVEIALVGSPAFTIASASAEVPGDGTAELVVTYTPDDYAADAATVQVLAADLDERVALAGTVDPDQDGDGVDAIEVDGEDCDDRDPDVHPGAEEVTDGVDQDCDGVIDENALAVDDVWVTEVHARPSGGLEHGLWIEVLNRTDGSLNLENWTVQIGASEVVVVGSDPLPAGARTVLALDRAALEAKGVVVGGALDGEVAGPGDIAVWAGGLRVHEARPASTTVGVAIQLDPDATDPGEPSGWCPATSVFGTGDRGTPGLENEPCPALGDDLDGDGYSPRLGDCDDTDPDVNPSAAERWNGRDDDCDGVIDVVARADTDAVEHTTTVVSELPAAVHDLDGDGLPDVIAWTRSGDRAVFSGADLLGSPATPILTLSGGADTRAIPAVSAGDLTGDGRAELVLPWMDRSGGVRIWTSPPTASGPVSDGALWVTGAYAWDVGTGGDVDGDGVDDLALPTDIPFDDAIAVVVASVVDAEGEVGAAELSVGSASLEDARHLALGDVNDDGYADLLVHTTYKSGPMRIFEGGSAMGDLTASDALMRIDPGGYDPSSAPGVGELDADPDPEIAFGSAVYDGLDSGALTVADAEWSVTGTGAVRLVALRDLDGDGDHDLAWAPPYGDGDLLIVHGPLTGGNAQPFAALGATVIELAGRPAALVDLDGDGDEDLIAGPGRYLMSVENETVP